MKTLNEFIEELIKLQQQGKGEYKVTDGVFGEDIVLAFVCDTEKTIII